MWSWLKRWQGGLFRQLFRLLRRSPRLKGAQFHYEKSGLRVTNEPIPWNAESVVLDFLIDSPPRALRDKNDYRLAVPGDAAVMAAGLEPLGDDAYRVSFRITPPQSGCMASLYQRARLLGQVALPHVSAEEFLQNLRLESPTVFVQLGGHHVACQALVAGQSAGLTACGLLRGPTSLLPAIDLNIVMEHAPADTCQTQQLAVRPSGFQLSAHQAVLCVAPKDWPDRPGTWSLRWTVGGRVLASSAVRVISAAQFQESLYVPHAPIHSVMSRPAVGCWVASREPGVAAVCPLEVHLQFKDGTQVRESVAAEVLVTDVPSLCPPATVAVVDFEKIEAIELYSGGQLLGSVCREPTPVAALTAEGGFRPPRDYEWTAITELELTEHLNRLLAVPR